MLDVSETEIVRRTSKAAPVPDPRLEVSALPCVPCAIRPLNICGILLKPANDAPPPLHAEPEWQVHKQVRARHNICNIGDPMDRVYMICEGWAFRFVQLPDGRRQILSIVLPGDVFTATAPFKEKRRSSVQALTHVRYCGFSRETLRTRLAASPEIFAAWAGLLVAETAETNELLVDLGCRSAEERIAHLILSLRERLQRRGLARHEPIAFPLRQRLIADIAGLTPEHVSRVINLFRRAGLIEIGNGVLRIKDLAQLQHIGELRV